MTEDPETETPEQSLEERITALEAHTVEQEQYIRELNDYITALEEAEARGNSDEHGYTTDALRAFEANQHLGEIAAWERETGLSHETGLPLAPPEEVV